MENLAATRRTKWAENVLSTIGRDDQAEKLEANLEKLRALMEGEKP